MASKKARLSETDRFIDFWQAERNVPRIFFRTDSGFISDSKV